MCVLGTLWCVLDVGGGWEGGSILFLPLCHALFLGGFHCFSCGCAPWLRGLVGWQMVLACGSGLSDRGSGGGLSVSIWLSRVIVWAALSWDVEFGGFWRWLMGFGVENPFSVSVLSIVPVCWCGSWDVGPERRGYVSVGISCSVHCCGFVVTVVLHHIVG